VLPPNKDKKIAMKDMNVRLSTLWVFVMFNMVFADIVGFLNPGVLEEMIAMKPVQSHLRGQQNPPSSYLYSSRSPSNNDQSDDSPSSINPDPQYPLTAP
jgi:hypothetical protein